MKAQKYNLFVLFLIVLTGVIMIVMPSGAGIYPHPSGKTVYLQGEACTINMGETDTNIIEINEQYIWCTVHHMSYLKELRDEK